MEFLIVLLASRSRGNLTYFLKTLLCMCGLSLKYCCFLHRVTSKLDEFTQDFHKELMKYRNAPKRRRSYSRLPLQLFNETVLRNLVF